MVSIITPAMNAAAVIGDCLASVSQQSMDCIHIVQDGGSSDGTTALASAGAALVESACDAGIYDAMNRGIRRSDSEVIGLLNADDFYAHAQVIEHVMHCLADAGTDACFGDLVYVRQPGFKIARYWKAWRGSGGAVAPADMVRALRQGWMPPHPALFVKRAVYEQYGDFRLDHGTAADYEFMLRVLVRHRIRVAYLPEVLVCMRVGGASNTTLAARLRANAMDRKAWETNGLRPAPLMRLLKPLRKTTQWLPRGRDDWGVGRFVQPWWRE